MNAGEYQRVVNWWETFLGDEVMRSYQPAVQHGDFWFGNFLVEGNQIVGLLDFENVGVDDPALDFAPLLYLGEEFYRKVLTSYENGAGQVEPGFEHRLRQLWALREFSGLEWSIENDDRVEFEETIQKIRRGPILSPYDLDGWAY